MSQVNHIHNKRISLRKDAAYHDTSGISCYKQSRLDEATKMETELFDLIGQYKESIENGDADLAYKLNSKIEELKLPFARFCA